MQLSKDQIDQLFAFTKKKMVHWHDLQVEIVDHLAERIEEEMNADSKLGFDAALAKVYAGFGIFGFAKIVQERENKLHTLGKRNFLNKLLQQLSWPTLMRTICIFLVVYLATTSLSQIQYGYTAAAALVISVVALLYRDKVLYKVKKKLVMLYNPFDFISIIFFQLELNIIFHFLFDQGEIASQPIKYPLLIAIVSSVCIYAFIAQYLIKNELKNEAKKLYPEAFA